MPCIADIHVIPTGLQVQLGSSFDYALFGHNEHGAVIYYRGVTTTLSAQLTFLMVTRLDNNQCEYAVLCLNGETYDVELRIYNLVRQTCTVHVHYSLTKLVLSLWFRVVNQLEDPDLMLQYFSECARWNVRNNTLVFTELGHMRSLHFTLTGDYLRKVVYPYTPYPAVPTTLLPVVVIDYIRRVSAVRFDKDTEIVEELVPRRYGAAQTGDYARACLGTGTQYDVLACGKRIDSYLAASNMLTPVGWDMFGMMDFYALAVAQRSGHGRPTGDNRRVAAEGIGSTPAPCTLLCEQYADQDVRETIAREWVLDSKAVRPKSPIPAVRSSYRAVKGARPMSANAPEWKQR